MNVKEIMTDNPACCTTSTKLTDVARMMVENDCGAIPVVDDMDRRNPVGVVTDRDIVCRVVAQGKDASRATAGECMSTELVCVTADTDVDEAARQMTEHQVRRVLVTDKDRHLCGIVAQADVAKNAGKDKAARVVQGVSA
jgi:CBS domain-containing protein